jgi:metal-responsive CopG/Arc/MetJ family transcriptional regulator
MSKNLKKRGGDVSSSVDDGGRGGSRSKSHDSGVSMQRSLFWKVDQMVKHLQLRSRGEFITIGTTAILDMCEDRTKRVVPEVVLRYDGFTPSKQEEPKIANPRKAQRCGTHFSRELEERIAAVVKHIGWSRNQFVGEAMKTILDMCEDHTKRVVPIVVIIYEAARAYDPPVKLKRESLHVVK